MMAGVVAVASVIEDFDTQPCKKSQNDGGAVVKTITNYFSPVPKPLEKPFSPPRPNNIMDYFTRKAPTKTSSPDQLKDDYQKSQLGEKQHCLEAEVKKPILKRSKKSSKAARKLVGTTCPTEEDCVIVEQHDKRESSAQKDGRVSSGDEVVNVITETCVTGGKLDMMAAETSSEREKRHDDNPRILPDLDSIDLSPILPSKDKAKKVKSNVPHVRKKQQQEEVETESSQCDVSMEVNVDEASQLNKSTVTISFEEFVRSQSQDIDKENDLDVPAATEEMDTSLKESVHCAEPVLQGSPQTVTIHAEVHAVSPKQDVVAAKKVASIFNRRKGATSPLESVSPAQMEARHKLPFSTPLVKRKSNVVLEEEDLELAVLESESTPKCTDVERKQFMAAFKQPALDGSKTKPCKSQGKTKQSVEKAEDITEKEEETAVPPPTEEAPPSIKRAVKNKLSRKSQKKEENKMVTASPAPEKEVVPAVDGGETPEISVASSPSTPTVRRSARAAVGRQTSTPAAPVRRRRQPSKPTSASVHPPAKIRKSKHGVFKAEMVCPPDIKQSPIRIKFTRIQKNVPTSKTEDGCGATPACNIPNHAKRRKRAKKLVEKARVMQQSRKASVEVKTSLRRSSRTEAAAKRSYCEPEDSIICLDDVSTTPKMAEKSKPQKSLRSLNDVLGKASTLCKDAKPTSGSKAASLGQEKTARRTPPVISIFDDSSCKSSENSQDDEQFKARREFLKSGLPDSLRKHIAKTTATKEAYSLSCSSFQVVTHTKQAFTDCPLWSLPWPQSSLLSQLQEFWHHTCDQLPPVSGSLLVETKPACRALYKLGSSWRPPIPESVRNCLTAEVSASNPSFPVEMFITRLLKRRADHRQQCVAAEPDPTRVKKSLLSAEPLGGKRKRRSEEEELAVKVAKKQRVNSSEVVVSSADPQRSKRGSRMRRAQRSKPEEESNDDAKPSSKSEEDPVTIILDEDTEKKDDMKEDVLWTDKYHPQHSSEIVGNGKAVRRLHSWLREWKLRADREERRKQTEKRQGEEKNDSDWDCGEEEFQDGEDMCNTLLITGPTGVGKTAAVYACALELGFKVFEVNASSQRSGRLILSQLKEATQSHQVDSQGVNTHKPSYFNSYITSSSAGPVRPGASPRKVNSPRRVVSSPRKHPQSPKQVKKGGLAPKSLANFFKMGRPANKEAPNTKKNEQLSSCKNSAVASKDRTSEEQSKKVATSLILFEEVDVIFDDDSGFLAAIKTFMTTTKRPVILTTSDPAFSDMFDGKFEEIHFKAPSVSDSSSFMQLLCLAEDFRTDRWDVDSLLRHNGCDMRQSLLQLQFWARSGGGHCPDRPNSGEKAEQETKDLLGPVTSTVPPPDACCTESMLGLLNIAPERDIRQLLRTCRPEGTLCWDLLANCKRRGVELLHSNMEILLPLPHTQLTTSASEHRQTHSTSHDNTCATQKEPPSPSSLLSQPRLAPTAEQMESPEDESPVKVSSRMRKMKKQHCLLGQDGLDSDSEDDFVSLHKPRVVSRSKEEPREGVVCPPVKRKPLTPEERLKSLPVSQCLQSLGDFFDNLSSMDSCLGAHSKVGYITAGALVKDGMTDEARVETDRGSWMSGERSLEIAAAVEALSFKQCCGSAADAWDKSKQLEGGLRGEAEAELTLPVAAHRRSYSYTPEGPYQPQLIQQRAEVMESLVFGTLCNRPAAAMEYLPTLRSICRTEQLREQGQVKRRFLHYLDAIHLGLNKSTLQFLAEDFP